MSRRTRWLLTVAGLALIVAVMSRPSAHDLGTTLPQNLGDPSLNTWILSWQSHAVLNEPTKWFDGNMFATHGSALGYSEVMLPLVPAFAVVEAASGNAVLAHNLVLLILLLFAMGTMYLLARRMRCSRLASTVAATGFTFSSFTFAHVGHLQLLTFGFFALGLLVLLRMLERRRVADGVVVGVVSAGLILACLYYATIWVAIVAMVVLVDLAVQRGRPGRDWWAAMVAAAVSAGILVGPVAMVYLRFQQRVDFSRSLIPEYGLDLSDLLAPAPDSYAYRTLGAAAWSRPAGNEHAAFIGIIIIGFALLATVMCLARVVRRRDGEPTSTSPDPAWVSLGVAAITSLVFSLGPNFAGLPMPFRFAFDHVPGFDSIRVPARLVVPFLVVVAVAAGRAITLTLAHLEVPAVPATLALLALTMVELSADIPRVDAVARGTEAVLYETLSNLPPGMVAELPAASVEAGPAGVYVEAPRLLYSIGDWRDRFNGTSGGDPPGFRDEVALANTFPSSASLDFLRVSDIRYVVLRAGADGAPFTVTASALEDAESRLSEGLVASGDQFAIFDLNRIDP